jgi:hypothetical protein
MTRPASHREQIPERRCGNCRFSAVPEYKDHLLCFFGDKVEIIPGLNPHKPTVLLDGEDVGLMEGDEYSEVWGGRVVEFSEVCDEWQPEPERSAT